MLDVLAIGVDHMGFVEDLPESRLPDSGDALVGFSAGGFKLEREADLLLSRGREAVSVERVDGRIDGLPERHQVHVLVLRHEFGDLVRGLHSPLNGIRFERGRVAEAHPLAFDEADGEPDVLGAGKCLDFLLFAIDPS